MKLFHFFTLVDVSLHVEITEEDDQTDAVTPQQK